MPEPVYIVSGHPRSGTSMMMRALMAGGMEGVYSTKRDELATSHADADYQPNPDNELFELESWQYRVAGFPAGYEGKLIKVVMHSRNMDVMPGGVKVVFMRRDPEEIRQSYMAFFRERRTPTVAEIEYEVGLSLRQMRDRRSFDVVELGYRDVVADPGHWLRKLDWPFDLAKAASEVRPELLRYKREELAVGIR